MTEKQKYFHLLTVLVLFVTYSTSLLWCSLIFRVTCFLFMFNTNRYRLSLSLKQNYYIHFVDFSSLTSQLMTAQSDSYSSFFAWIHGSELVEGGVAPFSHADPMASSLWRPPSLFPRRNSSRGTVAWNTRPCPQGPLTSWFPVFHYHVFPPAAAGLKVAFFLLLVVLLLNSIIFTILVNISKNICLSSLKLSLFYLAKLPYGKMCFKNLCV